MQRPHITQRSTATQNLLGNKKKKMVFYSSLPLGREMGILKSSSKHLLLLPLLINLLTSSSEAAPTYSTHVCTKGSYYPPNTTFQTNLNLLLSSLVSNSSLHDGFYLTTIHDVKGLFLCRGDAIPSFCHDCVAAAAKNITHLCTNQTESVIWYDQCMVRYSNLSFLNNTFPGVTLINQQSVPDSDINPFNELLAATLNDVRQAAVKNYQYHHNLLFATKEANLTSSSMYSLYTLAQCTLDLSTSECEMCLSTAISVFPSCCGGKRGARSLLPSCNIRYELYPFYNVSTHPVPDLPPPPSNSGKSNSTTIAIVVAVPVVAVVAVVFIFIYICLRGTKRREKFKIGICSPWEAQEQEEYDDGIDISESLQFSFNTIRDATNDFCDSNKLGQGGFGAVYRGRLSNGQEVAVKRLSQDSTQGDIEFKNEVLLVAKLQHRNLVRLLGFCLERRERLLVYEFVPNKSLDYFIFDQTKRPQLNWEKRYKIIVGAARGILYLHQDSRLRIIHRDLKASNILLDEEMNPKISDFGLARLFGVNQTHGDTNRIVGTYGYMAPEYAMHGHFSEKSDVFSFGVLILEVVSAQKNSSIHGGDYVEDLLSFAWQSWREGRATDIVDPTINNGSQNEIMRCIHIGLLCVQDNVAVRPTMASVLHVLNSHSCTLPLPLEPAFYVDRRTGNLPDIQLWEFNSRTRRSSEYTTRQDQESVNEASITDSYPR